MLRILNTQLNITIDRRHHLKILVIFFATFSFAVSYFFFLVILFLLSSVHSHNLVFLPPQILLTLSSLCIFLHSFIIPYHLLFFFFSLHYLFSYFSSSLYLSVSPLSLLHSLFFFLSLFIFRFLQHCYVANLSKRVIFSYQISPMPESHSR